ncbi:MAG: VWA domain-containing protein, partial [Planctomycetota bacterium]
MPIQYRCRCGQEVVLRTRESVYLIAGAAVLFTLINTVLLVVVWHRLGEIDSSSAVSPRELANLEQPEATEPSAPEAAGSQPTPVSDDSTGDGASTDPAREIVNQPSGAPTAESFVKEPIWVVPVTGHSPGGDAAESDSAAATAPIHPTDEADPSTRSPDIGRTVDDGTEVPTVGRTNPAKVRLDRPDDVDGLMLWLALEALPADPVERSAVLVAGVAWGTGFIRELAERRLAEESGRLGPALREWWAARTSYSAQGGERSEKPRPGFVELSGDLASELAEPWQNLGERLADRGLSGDRTWAAKVRVAHREPADRVLLIDLSESMEAEVAVFAEQLRTMLPLLDRPGGGQWGWIGFRDEVVDACELTGDVDQFLATLSQWRCEGGGDVPEGVDRAVFEALKFGRFEWSPHLDRRLLLFG